MCWWQYRTPSLYKNLMRNLYYSRMQRKMKVLQISIFLKLYCSSMFFENCIVHRSRSTYLSVFLSINYSEIHIGFLRTRRSYKYLHSRFFLFFLKLQNTDIEVLKRRSLWNQSPKSFTRSKIRQVYVYLLMPLR